METTPTTGLALRHRSSSTMSVPSSDDTVIDADIDPITSIDTTAKDSDATNRLKRTRKRFTDVQLMLLETLYHENSHPSREEREDVARRAGVESKSVTIWFQNRRQMERRGTGVSLNVNGHTLSLMDSTSARRTVHIPGTPRPLSRSQSNPHISSSSSPLHSFIASASSYVSFTPDQTHRRTLRRTISAHPPPSAPFTLSRTTRTPLPNISLDSVASRSQRPNPLPASHRRPLPLSSTSAPQASTSSRTSSIPFPSSTSAINIWDAMPSSPPSSSSPPRERELMMSALGASRRRQRTLDWACAHASLRKLPEEGDEDDDVMSILDDADKSGAADGEDTEEDDTQHLSTPGSSWTAANDNSRETRPLWSLGTDDSAKNSNVPDDDTMRAALALCGLGQGLRTD